MYGQIDHDIKKMWKKIHLQLIHYNYNIVI